MDVVFCNYLLYEVLVDADKEVWLHSNTHLAIIASCCHLSHNLRDSFNRTPVTTLYLVVLKLATTRTPAHCMF
jgi:hypothetical protein